MRQNANPEDARAYALRDGLNSAALAGAVAALKDDDNALARLLHPLLLTEWSPLSTLTRSRASSFALTACLRDTQACFLVG